jgi:hypothetical protein
MHRERFSNQIGHEITRIIYIYKHVLSIALLYAATLIMALCLLFILSM